MTEIWKDIKGYEGLYQVSNTGKVKRVKHIDTKCRQGYRVFKERMLKPISNERGYLYVKLSKNNKEKTFKIHRLVAQAFISNQNNYPQVNHKDEEKTNNHVDNLEWCTNLYNANYGTKRSRNLSASLKRYWKEKRKGVQSNERGID